ncbi:hypothetical protein LguiA_025003 [Lonicera macranthoides]
MDDALTTTLFNSIQALGRGFDVTSDIRLLYCKGAPGSRLIHLDDQHVKDLVLNDGFVVPNVSVDVECSTGNRNAETTSVCSFHEMATYFNEKSEISGHVPLGSFNSMFNFTGSWQIDAAATKSLAMIGYVIPLYNVKLSISNLVLHEDVKRAVPYSWDPASLASFIENYGTHIVTSATVGGRDVVYIRQHQSSPLSAPDIDNYVKDIGDQRFSEVKGHQSAGPLKYKDKDVTVIFRRRGGDDLEQSHSKWSETVRRAPDVINMTFTPIASLLEGVPGIKHLARAIDLYLELDKKAAPSILSMVKTLFNACERKPLKLLRLSFDERRLQNKPISVERLAFTRFLNCRFRIHFPFSLLIRSLATDPTEKRDLASFPMNLSISGVPTIEGKPAEEVKPAEQSQRIGCIHWNKSHHHLLRSSQCPSMVRLFPGLTIRFPDKPPIEDLQYFLEFQIARAWAPEQSNLQRKEPVCSSLQFSLMGPKLYISPDQVTVGRKPVTGLRLTLEGIKQNRLAIHLQHLVSLPKILQPHWDAHMAIGAPKWQGPEEQDSRWFEPIKWKNFSHVSTAPIEHTETCIGDLSGVHIVTGAQFGVWDFGAKSVLHLKLLFSKVPGCTIRRSVWDHSPSNVSTAQRSNGASTSDDKKVDGSSQAGKLAKIVDMTEMSKGPQDVPGHWLVTGAKLGVDKGKIVLRVKYSLLNY